MVEYPIAEKFKDGTYMKPVCKNTEFFIGGFHVVKKRFYVAVSKYRGARIEYDKRTEDKPLHIAYEIMRDYIDLV